MGGKVIEHKQGHYYLVDNSTGVSILLPYDWVSRTIDETIVVEQGIKFGFLDPNGKEVVPCRYEWIGDFSEGRASVKLNGKWGYIDLEGVVVVPLIYDYVWNYFKNRCMVLQDNKYGVVNLAGEEVIPCWYDGIEMNPDDIFSAYIHADNGVVIYRYDHDGNTQWSPSTLSL
jgi:hypothetical protein